MYRVIGSPRSRASRSANAPLDPISSSNRSKTGAAWDGPLSTNPRDHAAFGLAGRATRSRRRPTARRAQGGYRRGDDRLLLLGSRTQRAVRRRPVASNGPLRGFKRQLYEGGIRRRSWSDGSARSPRAGSRTHRGTNPTSSPRLQNWPVLRARWVTPTPTPTESASDARCWAATNHSTVRTSTGSSPNRARPERTWPRPRGSATGRPTERGGATELYDLSADVSEEHDPSDDHPELIARFERYFADAHAESRHWPTWEASDCGGDSSRRGRVAIATDDRCQTPR
jgi:hypothetical protein